MVAEIMDTIRRDYDPRHANTTKMLAPSLKADVIDRVRSKRPALETSWRFRVDGSFEQLRFQTGALSIVAAPTGHGKTTFLINALLDAVERYPDERHWLFSYEEDKIAVTLKALNAYVGESLSKDNRRTIENYYRNPESQALAAEVRERFEMREREFWHLYEAGRINIVECDYPIETLGDIIKTIAQDTAGFVGIDYMGLLQHTDSERRMTRQEELKRIALSLKDVAVATSLAIVATAQFNRDVLSPDMIALNRIAEAADIERAANKVIGLWLGDRPPILDPRRNGNGKGRLSVKSGTILLNVLKARDERAGMSNTFAFDGNAGTIGKDPFGSVGQGVKPRGAPSDDETNVASDTGDGWDEYRG